MKDLKQVEFELKDRLDKDSCDGEDLFFLFNQLGSALFARLKVLDSSIYKLSDLKKHGLIPVYRLCSYLMNDVKMMDESKLIKLKELVYEANPFLHKRYQFKMCEWLFENRYSDEKDDLYIQIAERLEKYNPYPNIRGNYYYVRRCKPFYVNDKEYYEITLSNASDFESKTKNKTVYAKFKIKENYSIKISKETIVVTMFGNSITKEIITDYIVAIRPCEISHLVGLATGEKVKYASKSTFYNKLMNHLTQMQDSLYDIVTSDDSSYMQYINEFSTNGEDFIKFKKACDIFRTVILNDKFGKNTVSYLLNFTRNAVVKDQMNIDYNTKNYYLNDQASNLALSFYIFKFERHPGAYSLSKHRVNMGKLIEVVEINNYDSFVYSLDNKCIKNQTIFSEKSSFKEFDDADSLMNMYNDSLDHEYHKAGAIIPKVKKVQDYYYRVDYAERLSRLLGIFDTLGACSNGYKAILSQNSKLDVSKLDSNEKQNIINHVFDNGNIGFIYGNAGSGKTELLCNYFPRVFYGRKILYVTNTHGALQNLRRRVKLSGDEIYRNSSFITIKSLKKKVSPNKYGEGVKTDLVLFDEARVISNEDIVSVLSSTKFEFEYLLFTGDVGQIESIDLGNWFDVCKKHFEKKCVFELTQNYRTTENKLLTLWNKTRHKDEDLIDYMQQNNFCEIINDSIFIERENQIILCLNYTGQYGINNINAYFQTRNKSKEITIDLNTYKVNDPVTFGDAANDLFGPLYNNLTGKILDFEEKSIDEKDYVIFKILIYQHFNSDEFTNETVEYISSEKDTTIVKVMVQKNNADDTDENDDKYVVPFDVSYALSIHKAQGLQYDYVKVIITQEAEEHIDNEVFYTAITRAKKDVKVYWTKESQVDSVKILLEKVERKDATLIDLT